MKKHEKIDIQLNNGTVINGIMVYQLKTKDSKINYKLAGKVDTLNIIGSGENMELAIQNFVFNYNYGYLRRGDKENARK